MTTATRTDAKPIFGRRDPDARGYFGDYGGRFVPETLVAPIEELTAGYLAARQDPAFLTELDSLLRNYVGRPTPLYETRRLLSHSQSDHEGLTRGDRERIGDAAAPGTRGTDLHGLPVTDRPRGIRLFLKREDLTHTGAHKINNPCRRQVLRAPVWPAHRRESATAARP